MAEDKIPLLERPGKGNDDDDEDFSPTDETFKFHQDFDLETSKTSTARDKLKELEINKNKANKIIMKRFPNYNPQKSQFTATMNEFGQVVVFLGRINAREYPLFINDEINKDLPPSVIAALGSQEEVEMMTPKTSTGRETLRPKKFKGEESKWGEVKTPQLKKNITDAMKTVEENFPNLNRSKLEEFSVNINEFNEITIKGSRSNAVAHTLFDDDGDMNESIPQTIKDILGEQISNKGLREQLAIVNDRKEQDDKIKKENEDLINKQNDKIKNNKKDAKLREQMSNRDMEEAKKEIDKITIEFNLERDKKINAEKKIEVESQKLMELQKKISSLEKQRVKTEKDKEVNEKSLDNFKKKLVKENKDLLKQLNDSEKLNKDLADITRVNLIKANEEVDEAKRSEAELTDNLNKLRIRFDELETNYEKEMAASIKMNNKILTEKNNSVRNLEVLKNASVDKNANYEREIQRLSERINDLEHDLECH